MNINELLILPLFSYIYTLTYEVCRLLKTLTIEMYNVTGLTKHYTRKNRRQLLIPSDKLVIIENKLYFKFQGKISLIKNHLT